MKVRVGKHSLPRLTGHGYVPKLPNYMLKTQIPEGNSFATFGENKVQSGRLQCFAKDTPSPNVVNLIKLYRFYSF